MALIELALVVLYLLAIVGGIVATPIWIAVQLVGAYGGGSDRRAAARPRSCASSMPPVS